GRSAPCRPPCRAAWRAGWIGGERCDRRRVDNAVLVHHRAGTARRGAGCYSLTQGAFNSVYLSKACSDLSRPLPDCWKPPNGAVMSPPSYWFTHALPARSALATRWARDRLLVHTPAARP